MVPAFMAYQAIIIKCYRDFEGLAWAQYDWVYRRGVAQSKDFRWSRLNPTLYSLCFAGKAKKHVACSFCLSDNHVSGSKPHPRWEFQFCPPMQKLRTCHFFNTRDGSCCIYQQCKFAHLCTLCKSPHPNLACDKRANEGPEVEVISSDLAWWHEFLTVWNSVSLLAVLGEQEPTITVTSDASGQWGCGAFWNSHWFQLTWSNMTCTEGVNIPAKELIPIVMAAAVRGKAWEGLVVCWQCDNDAVVAVLYRYTSRDQNLMHLLHCLSFFEVLFF